MKAIIYARISTDDEHQNINQQKDYCKNFAERMGYEVLHIIGDKVSGKIPILDRSGGKRLFKFLKENPTVHLIVQDIDRITRNYYDAVEFSGFKFSSWYKLISITEVTNKDVLENVVIKSSGNYLRSALQGSMSPMFKAKTIVDIEI